MIGTWRPGLVVGILATFASHPTPANAAPPAVGQIKVLEGTAHVLRNDTRLAAKVGDSLFEHDSIETAGDGRIGITFADQTLFSAGPDTLFSLDRIRFDSSTVKGSLLAKMKRGTLAVKAGEVTKSGPEAMRIETPSAVLGVRGTRFVVRVADDRHDRRCHSADDYVQ